MNGAEMMKQHEMKFGNRRGGDLYVGRHKKEIFILDMDEIYYISSEKREILVHTANDSIKESITLNQKEAELEATRFIRVNQAIIVNMNYVKRAKSNEIVLVNDLYFEISVRRQSYVRKQVEKYFIGIATRN